MAGAYGWEPRVLRDLTDAEATYYLQHLPEVYLRQVFPTAHLMATVLNIMGGKRTPKGKDGEQGEPPLAEHERFGPLELLPWYARPAWVELDGMPDIPPETARAFLEHMSELPSWVVEIAPLAAIRRAAEG